MRKNNDSTNSLYYGFGCLDGYYELYVDFNLRTFEVKTNIKELENRKGNISIEFLDELNKAEIEKWDRVYLPNKESIEDATTWQVDVVLDDVYYSSYGEESFYPYGFEHFIKALTLLDDNAKYFEF